MRKETYLHASYRLRSDHFEDSQFMNAESKNKLIWNTIPTVFEVPNPPPHLHSRRLHTGTMAVSRYSKNDVEIC